MTPRKLRHLDLFSGIGGFSLAASWTGVVEPAGFCEIDPWCRRVLAKHWPKVPQHDDIKTLTGDALGRFGRIDLVTGGFPCQGFSSAGRKIGTEDDRFLWPDMFRVIDECRPTYVLVENSPNIRTMVLARIKADLASIGHISRSGDIPALALDAQHIRYRHWITSHHAGQRQPGPGEHGKPIHPTSPVNRQATQPLDGVQGPSWPDESGMGRTVHGIPADMDRLRGLGNAIVPICAYEILSVMLGVEHA